MSNSPTQTPPGWYPNQHGQTQWWDGSAWGPVAPQQHHQQQYVRTRHPNQKSTGAAYCLLIFLGGTGAHRFYLGNTGRGVTMVMLLMLTIVGTMMQNEWGYFHMLPLIALWIMQLIDLFTLAGDVRAHNQKLMFA